MNKTTTWFLKQKALKIFLLSLLGIPVFIWLFSIVYQLDKNPTGNQNPIKLWIAGLATLYPIGYFFYVIGLFFNLLAGNSIGAFDHIIPFHMMAMLCGLILMILAANSYGKYEKETGRKTYEPVGVFFMLWFYIVGIWVLQPNLNAYMRE